MDLPPCNFRDVFPNSQRNSIGKVFRSNAVDDGHAKSAAWLRETKGIKSYIDLREDKEFCQTSKLDMYFTLKNQDQKKDINKSPKTSGHRFNIPILLLKPIDKEMKFFDYYSFLLDKSQQTFKEIFSVMKNREYFPIVISCRYGKDRTGVVAAVIMELMGCSDEEIINEYSKSEICLLPLKKEMDEGLARVNLDLAYATSPPAIMEKFLIYLRTKYNGAENYLKICGMAQEEIDLIKENLLNSPFNK